MIDYKELFESSVNSSITDIFFQGCLTYRTKLDRLNTAISLLRVAGGIIHSLWIQSKVAPEDFSMGNEVNVCFDNFWAGRHEMSAPFILNILQQIDFSQSTGVYEALITKNPVFNDFAILVDKYNKLPYKKFESYYKSMHDKNEGNYTIFSTLLKSLPMLKKVNFVYKTDSNKLFFRIDGMDKRLEFPAFPVIHKRNMTVDDKVKPFFLHLYMIDRTEPSIAMCYTQIDSEYIVDRVNLHSQIQFDSSYRNWVTIAQRVNLANLRPVMIEQNCGEGYRKIVRLSTCLAKALESDKTRLERFHNRFKVDLVKLMKHSEGNDLKSILTVIFLDQGINCVLEAVRAHEIYKSLINYLCSNEQRAARIIGKCEKAIMEQMEKLDQYFLKQNSKKDMIYNSVEDDIRINSIIAAAGDSDNIEYSDFIETIITRIDCIKNLLGADHEVETKLIVANKYLERTLRFLIAFYEGLGVYARLRSEKEMPVSQLEEHFLDKVRESVSRQRGASAGKLLAYFRNMLTCFSNKMENLAFEFRNDESYATYKCMESLIGRKEVCSIKQFNKLTQEIVEGINRCKHDGIKPSPTLTEADEILNKLITFMHFLRFGKANCIDPIYPVVLSFHMSQRTRNGVVFSRYTAVPYDEYTVKDVSIVTQDSFDSYENYYCLPNTKNSSHKWWIEPFFIKCSKVDRLFLNDTDEKRAGDIPIHGEILSDIEEGLRLGVDENGSEECA